MKGSCVAASPPGIATPKKHSEMKGDMEICPDTAVSEQTCHHNRTPLTLLQQRLSSRACLSLTLFGQGVGTYTYMHIPTGFHTRTEHVHVHKHIPNPAASSASYPLKAHY